jgi:hypothetical protein
MTDLTRPSPGSNAMQRLRKTKTLSCSCDVGGCQFLRAGGLEGAGAIVWQFRGLFSTRLGSCSSPNHSAVTTQLSPLPNTIRLPVMNEYTATQSA